jgi:hypothetical protein
VRIAGVTRVVNGLADSAWAVLSICHSEVVRELNVVPFGRVLELRGIVGQPVDAQLINLSIKSPDSDE